MIDFDTAVRLLNEMPPLSHVRAQGGESDDSAKLRKILCAVIEDHVRDKQYCRQRYACHSEAEAATNEEVGYFDITKNQFTWGAAFLRHVDRIWSERHGKK